MAELFVAVEEAQIRVSPDLLLETNNLIQLTDTAINQAQIRVSPDLLLETNNLIQTLADISTNRPYINERLSLLKIILADLKFNPYTIFNSDYGFDAYGTTANRGRCRLRWRWVVGDDKFGRRARMETDRTGNSR